MPFFIKEYVSLFGVCMFLKLTLLINQVVNYGKALVRVVTLAADHLNLGPSTV